MYKTIIKYTDTLIVFIVLWFLFNFFVYEIGGDYNIHLQSIIDVNLKKSNYSPHFLFYFLVNLLSGFSINLNILRDTAVIVLAAATTLKFELSKIFLCKYSLKIDWNKKRRLIPLISFFLIIAFSIPDIYNFNQLHQLYINRITPLVWHNSTTILVFPFTILLFMQHLKMDEKETPFLSKETLTLIGLVCLNIFIKPSFIFVYIPIAGLLIIEKSNFKNPKKLFTHLLPILICIMLLLGQFLMIYIYQIGDPHTEKSGISVGKPFEFLQNFAPLWYIPISILISYIYPIITIIFYKDILKFRPFIITVFYNIVALLLYCFFIETGPRKFDGNFIWQCIICSYLILLTTTAYLFPKLYTKERFTTKFLVLGIVFLLQFISGIVYIVKMYYTGSFY